MTQVKAESNKDMQNRRGITWFAQHTVNASLMHSRSSATSNRQQQQKHFPLQRLPRQTCPTLHCHHRLAVVLAAQLRRGARWRRIPPSAHLPSSPPSAELERLPQCLLLAWRCSNRQRRRASRQRGGRRDGLHLRASAASPATRQPHRGDAMDSRLAFSAPPLPPPLLHSGARTPPNAPSRWVCGLLPASVATSSLPQLGAKPRGGWRLWAEADAFEERDDAIFHTLSFPKAICIALCLLCRRASGECTVPSARQ